jgi:hypothetical protein
MFRALVMMVCLIAIPLAALFGSSLPDAIKALKEGRWPTLATAVQGPAAAKSSATLEEPPKFEPPAAPMANTAATTVPPPVGTVEQGPTQVPSPMPTPTPLPTPLPSEPPALASSCPPDGMQRPASAVVPTHYETTADPVARPPRLSPAPAQPAESDPYTKIQNRLRQLGATYYLLESWGGQQQKYRFYCKMAVGGNPNYPQIFEANDTDPLRAMSQVLQQVESWSSGR